MSTSICAAAGLIASTAIGEPAWAETGTGTSADTAQDIAYTLGYATPGICCLAVIAVVIVILVRRSKRR
jgi:ABC-type Fe3+ transport system permease subunit